MQLDWRKIRERVLSFSRWCLLAGIYSVLIMTSIKSVSLSFTGMAAKPPEVSNGEGAVDFIANAVESGHMSAAMVKAVRSPVVLWCFLGLLFLFVLVRMREERRLVGGDSDQFRGGNMFFRYGAEFFHATFSISFDRSWSVAKVDAFIEFIKDQLVKRVKEKLPVGIDIAPELLVKNLSTGSEKKFIRILARTSRGSLVSHFVHFETIGHAFTAHYFTFSRGLEKPSEVLRFVLESPVRIWFWFLPQTLSRYSILTRVSSFEDDSFDLIELQTRYQTINSLLWEETRTVFLEAGVLTAELAQTIVNNFTSAQQVNIGSRSPIFSVSNSPRSTFTQFGSVNVQA